MEFKVKRDFLSIFIINLILLLVIGVSLPFAYNAWVFVVAFGIALTSFCFYNTAVIFASCKLTKKTLIYRTGAFKYAIPVENIVKVTKEKNFYSSLALSVDRVRILTKENNKQKVYYISVFDKEKLIELLTKKEENKETIENKKVTKTTNKTEKTTANKKENTKKTAEETKSPAKKQTQPKK